MLHVDFMVKIIADFKTNNCQVVGCVMFYEDGCIYDNLKKYACNSGIKYMNISCIFTMQWTKKVDVFDRFQGGVRASF